MSLDSNGALLYNGGFVCDDQFDENSARVACMEMGYTNGYVTFEDSFDVTSHDFTLDNVNCDANAMTLQDCSYDFEENCSSAEGLYLECAGN